MQPQQLTIDPHSAREPFMSEKAALTVRNNPSAHRFEATVDGQVCHCDYQMHGNVMAMMHTEVPESLGGRGIAGQLVEAAIRHARENNLRIAPYCGYVRSYVKRHPEVHDVIEE